MQETWRTIEEFPAYSISDEGRVCNIKTGRILRPQRTMRGDLIVRLRRDGQYGTKSIRKLVARAFVPYPTDTYVPFDVVVLLDGNHHNLTPGNMVWRPMWFAQTYARQFSKFQESQWANDKKVVNLDTGDEYYSVRDLAMYEGVLMQDVFRSHNDGSIVFPTGCRYSIDY